MVIAMRWNRWEDSRISPETVLILRLKSEKNETVKEFIEPIIITTIS